jgi:hypothetical protein
MWNGIRLVVMSSMCVRFATVAVAAETPEKVGGVPDTPFIQEYAQHYPLGEKKEMNDVRATAVDAAGAVWAGTKFGAYMLTPGEKSWVATMKQEDAGPVFDVAVDSSRTVWIGAWNGLYKSTGQGLQRVEQINEPIAALYATGKGIVAVGPDGIWWDSPGGFAHQDLPGPRSIRGAVADEGSGLWIATEMGAFHCLPPPVGARSPEYLSLGAGVTALAYASDARLWVGGLSGITVYQQGKEQQRFTTKDGLPTVYVQSITRAPDGVMWVGTTRGVARYDGTSWSLRHSRRWLLDDEVRDVAFDAEGTAWIATAGGVSAIIRKTMSLAQKAEFFQEACIKRHVREPWLVEYCRLPVPGDISKWEPGDDDNDGQYTAMYLAMESFRYAVTKAPDARENAKNAFEALRFLQTVTETPGFFARTVVPSTWTRMRDPGDTLDAREWAVTRIQDPRYKKVEKRWRPSKDGKWLWKGDTSSDEVTGHFYGYAVYHDLAADDTQKEVVREHVRKVMDYIIDGGYVFKDIDGTHTRWGVWAPEKLNGDPDWAPERGVNSVEILSFLKATYHITGNEKYQKEYLRLLHEEHYADNVRHAKTYAPGWRTHIDDELLALAYPALLRYEKDPDLLKLYRESLDYWYGGIKGDRSPYFDFLYAGLTGTRPQTPDGIAFLRDMPLDLIDWTVDNAKREDIQLVRAPEIEPLQTSRLLPASERGVIRWDRNPWAATQGGGANTESAPTFWLLPYWMGRYSGFIE